MSRHELVCFSAVHNTRNNGDDDDNDVMSNHSNVCRNFFDGIFGDRFQHKEVQTDSRRV